MMGRLKDMQTTEQHYTPPHSMEENNSHTNLFSWMNSTTKLQNRPKRITSRNDLFYSNLVEDNLEKHN
jgi:hypothetical protein